MTGLIVVGLVILALVLALVLVVVNPILNPGPLMFTQRRVGRAEQTFTIFKFRSLPVAASDATRFGAFLRASHLDEVPQAFNILRRDMNLIGPRPEQVALYADLIKTVPCFRLRALWQPGMITNARFDHGYAKSALQHRLRSRAERAEMMGRTPAHDLALLVRATVRLSGAIGLAKLGQRVVASSLCTRNSKTRLQRSPFS
ncbi:MAG: sugar transferase [Pseudomonadota bacterium]